MRFYFWTCAFILIFATQFTTISPGQSAAQETAPIVATALRCDLGENPLGVDLAQPRLSWKLISDQNGQLQTAYQILVASDPEQLANNQGDLWDSGKVGF